MRPEGNQIKHGGHYRELGDVSVVALHSSAFTIFALQHEVLSAVTACGSSVILIESSTPATVFTYYDSVFTYCDSRKGTPRETRGASRLSSFSRILCLRTDVTDAIQCDLCIPVNRSTVLGRSSWSRHIEKRRE
jgi:hypothetical protein